MPKRIWIAGTPFDARDVTAAVNKAGYEIILRRELHQLRTELVRVKGALERAESRTHD